MHIVKKIDLKESPAFEFVVRIQDNFPHYFASSPKVTLHPKAKRFPQPRSQLIKCRRLFMLWWKGGKEERITRRAKQAVASSMQ